MAAGDRETTLILKASDLSSQTIEKVLATAAKLLTFQDTLNAKVASGTVKISEFNGSLNNIMQVFTALAQMKLVFPETERLERVVATQQARVEALRARAAAIEAIPEGDRTRKQQSQLDRLTSTDLTPAGNPKGTIAREDQRLELNTARLQRNLDLERAMGVTEENRAALQEQVNAGLERHTQELLRAKNAQLEIVEANYREREAQQAIAKAAAEVEGINRRALADTKAQEAALRELTSEANAFDRAMAKAFDDAAKAADRAKGDQFKIDFGDAEFENRKRDEAERKAKADQEQAAADAYRLMRAQADDENKLFDLVASNKRAKQEDAAKTAYLLMREQADAENKLRDKQRADAVAYAMQSAELEDKERTAALRKSGQTAQQQADELTKYLDDARRKAADFRAGLPAIQPFGEAVPGVSGFSKTTETVAAIDAIRDPATAARQTFEGLRLEIDKTNAAFETSPKRIQDASKATGDLVAAFNDLRRQASVFDLFRQAEAETVRTTQAMQEAVQKLNALERQQASATVVDENLTRAIKAQRAEVASSISAYNAANASFARFKEGAHAAGLQTTDTNAQLKAFGETAILVSERLDALDKITGKSTKSQPILFGLRGYELQNLGYQINDVVTGFASGQQALQILAQQGGQIFQIWERDIGTMLFKLREMPLVLTGIGAAVAVVTVAAIALVNQLDKVAAQRQIIGNLSLGLDPGANTAKGLNEAAVAASHLGASLQEATKGAIELSQHGFSDADVKRILTAAQNLSVARGKPLADSIKAISEVLHGSTDDLRKFSQEWIGLESNVHKAVEQALLAGHAQEGQILLLDEIARRAEEAANKTRSRVGEAMILLRRDSESNLTGMAEAWDGFWAKVIRLADTGVKSLNNLMNKDAPFWKFPLSILMGGGLAGALNPSVGRALTPTTGEKSSGSGYLYPREGFATALSRRENPSGDPAKTNAEGFVGNYQYGSERLHDILFDGQPAYTPPAGGEARNAFKGTFSIPGFEGVKTLDDFKKNAAAQQAVFVQDYKQVQELIEKLDPSHIFDQEGLHALAHLGGVRTMRDFIASGGKGADTPDSNRTRPIDYYREFSRGQPGVQVGGATTSPTTDRPNAQQLSTEEFQRKQAEQQFSETIQIGTLEQKNAALAARLDKIVDDVQKAAAAEANKLGGVPVNEEAVKAAIKTQSDTALREYLRTLAEQDQQVLQFRREISQRELNADKTNLQARLEQNKVEFDAQQRQADILKNSNRFQQAGVTGEQVDALISKARIDADNRTRAEVAAAIWDKFNSEQKAALDVYGNNIRQGINVANNLEKARQEVVSRAGAREEARQKAQATLQGVPETAETRALRARIDSQAAIAARPPDLKQFTQEAAQQTAQPVEEQFKALEEMMKGLGLSVQRGARPFSEALQEATTKLQQRLPELTRATNDAVAGLQRLIEGGATPAQIEEYKLKQQELLTRLKEAPKDILLVINGGLEDSQKELESLVKRFKDLMAQAVQLQTRGQLAAAQDAVNKANELLPQIGSARDKLVGNTRQAAKTPGLPAGEVASLEERADKAQKEGDPQQLRVQGILDQAKGAEEQIKQFQSSLREHAATEQQLLAKGLTTQTAYEAEMKRAYEETAAQAAPAIQRLLDLADAAEKAGASASKVAQLRDQAKLLRAELAYIPPLTQQIIQGFEQSFVSRGEQAFDAVAKSIGTAIATGGKFKDVLRATGNAFANMAAGILEDVAKIIIKYELLKLIKDTLGVDTGTGGGSSSSSGGGGSSTGGILQGILKVAGIAASAWAGSAGGVSDSGAFVGSGGGAATAADADALSSFANDAAGAGYTSEEYAQALADGGATKESINALAGHNFFHEGGMVGWPGGMSRQVDLSVFHEAQRMHSGGMVGLASDEVPAILQRNEEVLSKSDPRNRMNLNPAAGSGGDAGTSIRNVLAVGDKEIASAMNSSHGERVILNVLQRNAPTVKKYVG